MTDELTPRQQYVRAMSVLETQVELLQRIHRATVPMEGDVYVDAFLESSLDLITHTAELIDSFRMIDTRIGIDDEFAEKLVPELLHALDAMNDSLTVIRDGMAENEE